MTSYEYSLRRLILWEVERDLTAHFAYNPEVIPALAEYFTKEWAKLDAIPPESVSISIEGRLDAGQP